MPTPPHRPPGAVPAAWTDRELDDLQHGLDRVPAPLEPLDVSMLDGYLCGVLLQPRRIDPAQWLPYVTDVDGRPLPPGFDARPLRALVQRRHAELDAAIGARQWFDPWVFELEDDGAPDDSDDEDDEDDGDVDDDGGEPAAIDAVYPWVAGFATAQECFPDLMALDADALTEPLALIYRHFDAEDLEDADALLAEIESLEPPSDLSEAVEGLVRATLLLADISRPVTAPSPSSGRGRPGGGRGPSRGGAGGGPSGGRARRG